MDNWERAESTATKTVLFAIFGFGMIAQFVKPVGDAVADQQFLGGALLSLVGFVLYSAVQRLTERLDPPVEKEVAARDLDDYFGEALNEPETRIDALGFTGQTVVDQLSRRLEALPAHANRRVFIRVLVPDLTKPMAIPGMLNEHGKAEDDPQFRGDLHAMVVTHHLNLTSLARRLQQSHRAELVPLFRVLHFSPSVKFCLINDEHLFDGIYDKVEMRPADKPPDRQVIDLQGYNTLLRHWYIDDGTPSRMKILQRKEMFENLWSVAQTLDEGAGRASA